MSDRHISLCHWNITAQLISRNPTSSRTHMLNECFHCVALSGSPYRVPPGSAGQLSARLYILHPGNLCVCSSALHPGERTEVHHLRLFSVTCKWVVSSIFCLTSFPDGVFFFTNFHLLLMSISASLQVCASWSQPPSTQTASTWTRRPVGTATATSWRGSPSLSRSSPPSFTLCYARRRREKETGANSSRPEISSSIFSLS